MSIENELQARSGSKCELCAATDNLSVYEVLPKSNEKVDSRAVVCEMCLDQIESCERTNLNHWRCLNDSMWTEVPAIKVIAWRMLNRLCHEGWAQDLLDLLYLDEETLAWAKATKEEAEFEDQAKHLDCNGVTLQSGDTVVLTKDLNVKGANFTAKRGTAVRGISLVRDNAEQIEGKISGQQIVILTKFVKKSS